VIGQDALDDLKARQPIEAVAGRYVRLRRSGVDKLVGPCPVCGGRATSARFEIRLRDQAWVCAVCPDGGDVIRLVQRVEGCDFRTAIERLGGAPDVDPEQVQRLQDERDAKRAQRDATEERYREATRTRLWKQWKAAGPVAGTPVEAYLRGRGLDLPASTPGLRALSAAAYCHGELTGPTGRQSARVLARGWAMAAAFIRADGTFGGLHLTHLDDGDPPAKLVAVDPDTGEILPAKKMHGSKRGAHILVAPSDGPPRRLVVGEGIETTLAVWTAHLRTGRPLDATEWWAAGDLGNLAGRAVSTIAHPDIKRPDGRPHRVPGPDPDPDDAGLAIPDSVTEIVLLGDGDSEPVLTRHAMTRAARRFRRPGRTIRCAFAPTGLDFNDLLRAG
jgi:hypothetical protein